MDKVIISASELLKLNRNKDLIIIDARSGQQGKDNYSNQHLEGAVHVDLDKDLSDIKEDVSIGGRHPLPHIKEFAKLVNSLGISLNSHVVVYDDKNGANAAARFWWMLKALGHKKVEVLNGGFKQAQAAGFPLSSKTETAKKVEPYPVDNWKLPIVDITKVEKVAKDPNYLVIDVRTPERYNGETEPIDLIAGHIPGATNIPLGTNLDKNGLFLSPETLKRNYQNIMKNKPIENIIVHCGSGVTACHTLLAFAHAEFEIPNLYVGSWSEWSRNNKPIGTNL